MKDEKYTIEGNEMRKKRLRQRRRAEDEYADYSKKET